MKHATCQTCNAEFTYSPHHKRGVYCSLVCSNAGKALAKKALSQKRYDDWLAGATLDVANPRGLIREFVIKRDGNKCNCCGIDSWNGKEITLWCDHIDGNAANNAPDNFQMICPNCDSQQSTFGAKNTGSGRKARGLPQYG